MSECDSIRDLLVMYAEGWLDHDEVRRVGAHLRGCAACRFEAEAIGTIRGWLLDPEVFAPQQTHAWQTLPERLAVGAQACGGRWLPLNFGSPAWALSLAATVLIGFALIYWIHTALPTGQEAATVRQDVSAPGNETFLDRVYAAHVRQAAYRYLAGCQDLVLSTLRAEANCDQNKYDVSAEVAQARELLARKRLLDPELSAPEVAHARELCDELESFLLNLSMSQKCETPDRIRRLEHYVRKQHLLLRIRIIQGELS